ncbi:hypothetical protein [Streptacidiphilus neutrinimicus]|uniref:hypothetical protein n=1 Tax=Streptacidiphilus neutrinimicus TaxID=105420 RepID=UPI0005A644DE|nr:hypothetical protein [Streptacidiphilus neutrinimicus]
MSGGEKLLISDLGALQQLDLSAFPAAADFEIELTSSDGGSSIRFADHGLNVIIEFPWWEDVASEIAQWSLADIPSGSIDSPYWDMDQGWHVAIWQAGDLVYIAQGGEIEGEYERWFAVPNSIYRAEWERVIRLASSRD